MMSVYFPIFSIPIYIGEIHITDKEKQICDLIPMFADEGNFFLSHSNKVFDIPLLSNMKTAANDHLKCYATDVFKINQQRVEFNINTSWILKMDSQSVVKTHNHMHSIFTGVMVVDCTPDTKLYFAIDQQRSIPAFFDFEYDDQNEFNSVSWHIDLKPNHIFMFPSCLKHYAKCLQEEGTLTTLSFDSIVRGRLGRNQNEIEF